MDFRTKKLNLPYRTIPEPTLCIITPTTGRPSIGMTLDSALIGENDEWLVMGDGEQDYAKWRIEQYNATHPKRDVKYSFTEKIGNYGNHQRDVAMQLSQKDWFVFIDDDDVFAPNALNIIKRTVASSAPCPWFFRMITPNGELLWKEQVVSRGVVGGSMFVVPNVPEKLARWSDHNGYDSDFLFIEETLKFWRPVQPKWAGDVIIVCKPMHGRLKIEVLSYQSYQRVNDA